ncbi:unannotated protein [freshwater metagenome]|uniref:Unannotated protein n=1 Tax=freshwater metagenome TaxID=449393 RepID=A0A6J7F132_9ZZZZ|nr:L,D-transpeptidase family protein [Actinomycetota bacterium]
MRREYRILLATLAGFVLLVLGARLVGGGSPSVSNASPIVTEAGIAGESVAATPTSVPEVIEPIGSDPAATVAAAATAAPAATTAPVDNGCVDHGHSAVVDRAHQRAWLCNDGHVADTFPMTGANSQPDPGTYKVYAKDLKASSNLTGRYSTMTHFVAFTHGKYQGARIAFHSIPKYANGEYVQPLDSVGTAKLRGASSGCIRVLYDDSVKIWNWLKIGDPVVVIS